MTSSLEISPSKAVEKPTTIVNPFPDLKPPSSYQSGVSPVPSKPPALFVNPLSKALPPLPAKKPALPAIAFGAAEWKKYLGDVGVEPPLPPNIQEILQSSCPFFPSKRVEETHLLTLIPKTVNGKHLTLNSLEELVKKPKQGKPTQYRGYSAEIKKEYGEQPLQNSYWILMTRDVIPGSRSKIYNDQAKLLLDLSQKAKVLYLYEVPLVLEVVTSVFVESLRTGKWLYGNNPCTYTCCKERVSGRPNWPLVFGAFAKGGLRISLIDIYHVGHDHIGVAGLKKF